MANIPFGAPGIAGYATDEFSHVELRLSEFPVMTTSYPAAASQDLPIYTVVGLDGSGRLIPAGLDTDGGGPDVAVAPVGITMAPIKTAAGEYTMTPVAFTGHFNIDALNFSADYDTDAKKLAAFNPSGARVLVYLGKGAVA